MDTFTDILTSVFVSKKSRTKYNQLFDPNVSSKQLKTKNEETITELDDSTKVEDVLEKKGKTIYNELELLRIIKNYDE